MPNEKTKTYRQHLKDYFYGPPRDRDHWEPFYVKTIATGFISEHISPYAIETATDPYLRGKIWELLFGVEPNGGPIKLFYMDKNDEKIFIERSRSGQKERYLVPKSDHQEPGSFRLLDDLFNAMHYFFRVEWSSDAYRINTNEEAIMRLCLDLKEKYKLNTNAVMSGKIPASPHFL